MKSKKKLLLMGVGVMGALAMGVGATSTFAWFQAQAAATASATTADTGTIGTKTSDVTVDNVEVQLTVVSGSNVELSFVDSGTVYYGAYNAGNYARTAWNQAEDAASHPLVASFTVTATATGITAAQKSAVAGKSYTFGSTKFTALGNVVFVGADAKTASTPSITVSFDANGVIAEDVAETTCTYAVRTNNPWGLEVTDLVTSAIAAQAYKLGDAVREGAGTEQSPYTYWVCKSAYTHSSGTASGDDTHWQRAYLHSEDGVSIESTAVEAD